jgi:hypothetical protein
LVPAGVAFGATYGMRVGGAIPCGRAGNSVASSGPEAIAAMNDIRRVLSMILTTPDSV